MDFNLALSQQIYYVQTDEQGVILDTNQPFIDSFNHVDPYSIDQIIHPSDMRSIRCAAERLRRAGKGMSYVVEVRTLNHDKEWSRGYCEIQRTKSGFVAAGFEYMVSYEDGFGKLKQYRKLWREAQFSLNHLMRKEVANIEGLILLEAFDDPFVIRNLVQSIGQLNVYLRNLTNKIDRFNK